MLTPFSLSIYISGDFSRTSTFMLRITSVNFSGHEMGNFGTVGKCVNNNNDKKILLCQNQSFLIRKGPLLLVFPLEIIFFLKTGHSRYRNRTL